MNRREFMARGAGMLAVLGAPGALLGSHASAAIRKRQYNVLFIAVDDLRPELGCYGLDHMRTPNIDALGDAGTVFTRAYCQQAVCSPSRTSLMTGCRPDTTRVWDLHTHFRDTVPDVLTLGQHFIANGYHAEAVGKIYHGTLDDPKTWSVPWKRGIGPGPDTPEVPHVSSYFSEEGIADAKASRQKWIDGGRKGKRPYGMAWDDGDAPDVCHGETRMADYVATRFERLEADAKPFFMAIGFRKPHLPFTAPKKYWDLYDPAKIDLADNPFAPKGAPPEALHNSGELRAYSNIPRKGRIDDETALKLIHGYRACCSFTDANVGRVIAGLERNGLAQNTIVILWGDHGWHLGDHGLWCKHTNFETATHAPLIIRVPGQEPAKCDALVEFADIYPSLSDLCGLELPAHLEGASFAPLIDDPNHPWKAAALSQYPRGKLMGYTLRADRYRYTEWRNKQSGEVAAIELYDHHADPAENENVAARPENVATLRELAQLLASGWQGCLPPK